MNITNPEFGRVPGEPASGHWLYAFLRVAGSETPPCLVLVNLHRSETFRNVRVLLSDESRASLAWLSGELAAEDRVSRLASLRVQSGDLFSHGLCIPELPPLTPAYFEIRSAAHS